MHDQPVAIYLTIAVGNPYRAINRVALQIGARDTLKAVTKTNVAIHRYTEISDGDFRRAPKVGEHICPGGAIGVSAGILLPRHHIEKNETFIWYVGLHDCVNVAGIEGRCKSFLERPDRSFI